jgi:glycosyltransferase involved in cell wall biosynthesis
MSLDLAVCIPLHDPENVNEKFLRSALDSLVNQDLRPSQVIMTSSTDISYVHQVLAEYGSYFEFVYEVKETNGASMNFNNCVALANRTIVQLLCQDDFLKSPKHLVLAYRKLVNSKKYWMVSGCRHFEEKLLRFDRRIFPKYTNGLLEGYNTIGAPSVVTFHRKAFIPFDTQLHYMYDCDWYVRMFHNWGKPLVARRDSVGIRIHENQSTNEVSGLLEKEIKITGSNHLLTHEGTCICVLGDGNWTMK